MNKNTINICNKKNYKNDLNKIVKNSTNSKKKNQKKNSDLNLEAIDANKSQQKFNIKNQLKNGNNNIPTLNYNGSKEEQESIEKFTKQQQFVADIRKKKSRNKILRNVNRTNNNIIGHVEKLIKQSVDVQRGVKKLRANNIGLLNPLYHRKLKKHTVATVANMFKEHQQRILKEKNNTRTKFTETGLKNHDSIQEIMFSNSFKERSDSSRIEYNNLSGKWVCKLKSDSEENLKEKQQNQQISKMEQFYDCSGTTTATDVCPACQKEHQNNFQAVDRNDETFHNDFVDISLKQKSSSKMLVHFKDLLNHYLKNNAIGETKFFLSKDDIEFLRKIVEADEKYHQLHMEDHTLLKEILVSQLEEIQLHQNIVDNILKTLRSNASEQEDVVTLKNMKIDSKDKVHVVKSEKEKVRPKMSKKKIVPFSNKKDKPVVDCDGDHITPVDAQEPNSYVRLTWDSEDKTLDDISWCPSSNEQLTQLLNNDNEKTHELLENLLLRANKKTYPNDYSNLKSSENQEKLDVITERTELSYQNKTPKCNAEISMKDQSLECNIEKEDKKLGVQLKEIRQENYVIIENPPAESTVHPINVIIEAYSALEFVKQNISLERLKEIKEVYIPKQGSQFEMEKVDYEHLINHPQKLERILISNKKKLTERTKQKVVILDKTSSSDAIDKVTVRKPGSEFQSFVDEIDRIGLAVALFENYNSILESIEEVNQYIRTSMNKMEACCNTIVEQVKPADPVKQNECDDNAIQKVFIENETAGKDLINQRSDGVIELKDIEDLIKKSITFNEYFEDHINNLPENCFLEDMDKKLHDEDENEFEDLFISLRNIEESDKDLEDDASDLKSETNLLKKSSKIIKLLSRSKAALVKTGLKMAFQSCLFALVVLALSLSEPYCQLDD